MPGRGWICALLAAAACVAVEGFAVRVSAVARPLTSLPSPSLALARTRMQVAEPPVKVPDKVPQFAPTQPKSDKANEKGKKYKLLLFNDNVNRCAARRSLVTSAPATGYDSLACHACTTAFCTGASTWHASSCSRSLR